METIKQFKTSLILLGLFLIFAPAVCYADMYYGYSFIFVIFLSVPLFSIPITFIVICLIEAFVIRSRLKKSFKDAFSVSLLSNLITSIIGFIIAVIIFSIKKPSDNVGIYYVVRFFNMYVILLFFLGSFFVESIILKFFYRHDSLFKIIKVSLIMNILSYLFMVIILPILIISIFY